ncbi:hybrid-cluster NAD(P)-dependent oxidoreductase [Shewanella litorisediminis]|uniref:Hybrid-cluster NAD(P)-dependent oxidoreductase n=1 Tax=Shewanella litorisediminis TaxID=1173586 RepID=A0ABX7G5L8_9GAMM|nr:hybrid-cluster NAD(P)-dependent oxidoreductase [Shewanella litorisediminis]MCL2917513.1 hybrid-cluster NAD(P)-dependent oxidoreductase [Shewanella litorisediminis]QRH02642.1 hybrid-cluster NAD(P)-dependent oxidoreductase [Shewanella litorisediminis]
MSQHRDAALLAAKPWQDLPPGTPFRLCCMERIDETHDVVTFRFEAAGQAVRFNYKPGQFISLLLEIAGEPHSRAYTLSSSPSRPYSISITVKRVEGGLVSNYLIDNLRPGHALDAMGPSGSFNLVDIPADRYLFLSAGCGITPMFSMSRWLTDTRVGADIAFVHSAKSANDLIFARKLESMANNHSGFRLGYVIEQGDSSDLPCAPVRPGRLTVSGLDTLVSDWRERTLFVCGPEAYMAAVEAMVREAGFAMSRFHQESFGKPGAPTQSVGQGFMLKVGEKAHPLGESGLLLEGIEALKLPIIAACRSGVCGACKCQVLEGDIERLSEMTLTEEEKANGMVLACSTRALSHISLKL